LLFLLSLPFRRRAAQLYKFVNNEKLTITNGGFDNDLVCGSDQLNFAASSVKIMLSGKRSANKVSLYKLRSEKLLPYFTTNFAAISVV